MTSWSLPTLLDSLHQEVDAKLRIARASLHHPGTKGAASESVWLDLLRSYLPKRYAVASAHIVDSLGQFSDQMDIVVYDRQYTPPIFEFKGYPIVPSESVYAIFEAKQEIDASQINYASRKIESVRKLFRTSLPIPYADGTYRPRQLTHIVGGILTLESGWTPPLGQPLVTSLQALSADGMLDIGCVSAHGIFRFDGGICSLKYTQKASTLFLLELIARLQSLATVPMIDVQAYARWLDSD